MNELKPCPFCGREVRIARYVEEIDYDICWIEHVEKEPICFLYSARGYVGKQKDLIELWNKRSVPWCDKEHEVETEWCERCGRVRLKSKWEGR